MYRSLAAGLLLLTSASLNSATLVEIREQETTVSWVEISGQQVRMTGVRDAYVLVDITAERFIAVFPSARQAMDISGDLSGKAATGPQASPHRLEVQRRDAAENIAGFSARQFGVVANGRLCAEVWLSREALDVPGISEFLRALSLLSEQQRTFVETQGMSFDACDDARHSAMMRYPELGLPLRIRDAGGNTLQEIVSIETNVGLGTERFRIPKGYEILNAEGMR